MTAPGFDQGCDGPARFCGARTRSGGSCRRPAGWGTNHVGFGPCKLHGGCTPTVSRGAHRQAVEHRARAIIAAEGLEPVADPVAVMTRLAAEAVALVGAFRHMVEGLDTLRYPTKTGEQLRAEVVLYERALDRAEKFAHDLAKLRLEERVVRITEAQATSLYELITVTLTAPELGLTTDQIESARRLLAAAVRSLDTYVAA